MTTLQQADIFFFISSIGFIVLFVILLVLGLYLIRISRNISRITEHVERDIETIGDTAKEFVLDLQQSSLFSLLFRKRKKYTKSKLSE